MRNQAPEVIEYDWDERTEMETYTLEDQRTGAITFKGRHAPLKKPEVTEALRKSYFSTLKFWLETQPQDLR